VQALGSTTDPSLQSDIIPLLNDPAPGIRSAAAQTLGRLGTDDVVAEQLMLRFEQESNNTVRGAIADALVSWESPSPAAMASIRVAIRLEPDEDARYNMARFLANNLAEFPENRIVLENLLRSEQSQRIRQQISEMLLAARQM
jgi:HEAT repeat protein